MNGKVKEDDPVSEVVKTSQKYKIKTKGKKVCKCFKDVIVNFYERPSMMSFEEYSLFLVTWRF